MNNENRLFKIPFTTTATIIGFLVSVSGLLVIIAWLNDITILKSNERG
jgi:hypothetical protein